MLSLKASTESYAREQLSIMNEKGTALGNGKDACADVAEWCVVVSCRLSPPHIPAPSHSSYDDRDHLKIRT
jgi:predicted metal-binding transcription factor (methanogenesis marker protein 9)